MILLALFRIVKSSCEHLSHSVNGTSVDSKSLVNLTDPINV